MPQGKCEKCKIAYRFYRPRRLRDARCPRCGTQLERTSKNLNRFPWQEREDVPGKQGAE